MCDSTKPNMLCFMFHICSNLLLPSGVPVDRQRATYTVSIYKAEDLPRMDTGIFASMKNALVSTPTALLDAFVQVSFAGLTVRPK